MSAFIVSDEHLQALTTIYSLYTNHNDDELTGIMRDFEAENYRSVNYRYSEDGMTISNKRFNPVDRVECYGEWYSLLNLAAQYKVIACYEYQSCEHPEWETSEAKKRCDKMVREILSAMASDCRLWEVKSVERYKRLFA